MTILEAMEARHSVRGFRKMQIPAEIREELNALAEKINEETGLAIDIIYDDRGGFDSRLARYGKFENVVNYIVLAGKKGPDFDYRCGYYGEKIVLFAQQLGLNTCWAALTFNKRKVRELIPEGETLCMVISLGYGETQGVPRKSKTAAEVTENGTDEAWFSKGIDAALKAPTAVNQQKFIFDFLNGETTVRVKGFGSLTRVDLGIVAYHFEAASGKPVRPVF